MAYVLFFLMGGSFGLIGAGGSILSFPILVYILHINPIEATSYSFYIVGVIALIGSIGYFKKKLISIADFIYFAIPSAIGVMIARYTILPSIPDSILSINKDSFFVIVFSIFMVIASIITLKKKEVKSSTIEQKNVAKIIIIALLVGITVGMLGAGGGFLIIPALYNILKVEIKKAIATSLAIVSLNCLFAIIADLTASNSITSFTILLPALISSAIGMLIGLKLEGKVKNENIKLSFGIFTFILGLSILINETIKIFI